MASGDAILSGALVELEAEHVADVSTRAVADGSGWAVTGVKALVPAGQLAERILVPAAGDDGQHPASSSSTRVQRASLSRLSRRAIARPTRSSR